MFTKLESFFPNILYYTINKEHYVKISHEYIHNLLFFLKHHTTFMFQQLIDISAVDYPERRYRFELFYNLLSMKYNNRLTVTSAISEDVSVESVTSVYPAANWYERETWDMFGIFFKNHPDLRRILTDYGFKGHPLRKDFPMTGFIEIRYDDFNKRIVYETVSLAQEYRIFSLENNWSTTK